MAAFSSSSFQLLDSSISLPNNAFSQFYQHETLQNLDHSTKISAQIGNNNEASVLSVANKNSMNCSSIVTDNEKVIFMDKKRKFKEGTFANCAQSKDMREVKGKRQKKNMKDCEENKKSKEANKAGYIHVRARRGQATDSHSLAERVRRERISERMKILQAIVPGCDKLHAVCVKTQVTGKALMLDEIINYVQSLQNQVEFLSMKLASINPMFYDFGMDLESFMVIPDQNLSSFQSPLPGMQEYSPTTGNIYPILDNSANSLMLQHAQIPNIPPQNHRQVLWEVEDYKRQEIINQSEINNTLFSFH